MAMASMTDELARAIAVPSGRMHVATSPGVSDVVGRPAGVGTARPRIIGSERVDAERVVHAVPGAQTQAAVVAPRRPPLAAHARSPDGGLHRKARRVHPAATGPGPER